MPTINNTEKHLLYIDGKWLAPISKQYYDVVSPTTGEIVSQGSYGDHRDAAKAIHAAHNAFKTWSRIPATERNKYLFRIYDLVLENEEELARIISTEMGKPLREAYVEVKSAADYILWSMEEGKRTYGNAIPSPIHAKRLQTIKQPIGPVAAITPWNFPLSMVTRKVAPALAAGCTVVFKPDNETPGSAVAFFKIVEQANLPDGVLNLVTGNVLKIGDKLLEDQRIKKLTFTGSTKIGKFLMEKAAVQVKNVSMELGGCAPYIVFEDANLEEAVEGAIASKFRNSGQTCIKTNRIYVQESIQEQFLARLKEKVEQLVIGNGLHESVDFGAVINASSLVKVKNQVRDALDKGAKLITGGKQRVIDGCEKGFFYEPTIIADVNEQMIVSYDENDGPLVPVYTFKTEEEVIGKANDSLFGLASSFFTNDLERSIRMAEALKYGMVDVNNAFITSVKGRFSREDGPDNLNEFLETKFISTGA